MSSNPKMSFCIWFHLFLIVLPHHVAVDGAYFSMADVHLTIPMTGSKDNARILMRLYTLPHSNEDSGNRTLKYALQGNENRFEIVDGYLALTEAFYEALRGAKEMVVNISVGLSVVDSSGQRDKATFSLHVVELLGAKKGRRYDDCDFFVKDLCYWQSAVYRVLENRRPAVIGSLGLSPYLRSLCPNYRVNYTMETKALLQLDNKSCRPNCNGNVHGHLLSVDNRLEALREDKLGWRIKTAKPLERDVSRSVLDEHNLRNKKFAGEFINFTVVCHIESPSHTVREIPKRLSLRVLDENDNPPRRQGSGDVFIIYNHPFVRQSDKIRLMNHDSKHEKLIFTDKDSMEVNNHTVRLLNDTLDIFAVKCSEFNEDRFGERQTVQSCDLSYKRDVNLAALNISNYTVILEIKDTTMVPLNESNYVHVVIHLTHKDDDRLPEDFRPLQLYKDREHYVFRLAGPLARVVNPPLPLTENISNFQLIARDASYLQPFAITPDDGIIYVNNITSLRDARAYIRVDVQWEKAGKYHADQLIIEVKDHPSRNCSGLKDHFSNWIHCSYFDTPEKCESACGLGGGGATSVRKSKSSISAKLCQWRGHRLTLYSQDPSDRYNTCSPDVDTCPDGHCDSLEARNWKLCPQDCTERVVIPTLINKKTNRGITHARGVCTCSGSGNCSCGPPKSKVEKGRRVKTGADDAISNETFDSAIKADEVSSKMRNEVEPNLSPHTRMETAACGTGCMLSILAVGVLFLSAIASIAACWRMNRVNKMCGKYGNNSDHSAPLSEYVDRGLPPPDNTLMLNFDMTTSLLVPCKTPPDPKWEFPRCQLTIEQTLGEGEFGRVLRARAKDIAGHSGYTIVAVKTLKDDAQQGELADLLSEYQLLKEVSHPNIIKLLGASTIPGGPVYLIIEYAQYGSLRSYLRRSRHLKSETQLPRFAPCLADEIRVQGSGSGSVLSDNYDQPKSCKVTPKDILSFAWQIANGMRYLTEIKLVHRDLAARNVLLSADKVCKISDFGLTRDIYEDDAYFKRSKGRVPVKWMAPESLTDHVYTIKSDVWSFGILSWELVTLGATPYPGIQVQNLYHLLKSGYRMERPENCSVHLYKIMKNCWLADPEKRPSFHELSAKFEAMLEDQVEYLNLTANSIHNRSYFCTLNGDDEDELFSKANSSEQDEELETNLERNSPREKLRNNEKLVEEKINKLLANSNAFQVSPAKGYETPVKRCTEAKYENADQIDKGDPIGQYTNMEASRKLVAK